MPIRVIIVGAGGHARVVADIVRCSGDIVEGFLDDREATLFPSQNILGHIDNIERITQENPSFRFIIGIGNNETREKVAAKLGDVYYYTAIHPSAVVASDVTVGEGSVIMANVVVNTGSVIRNHVIINTGATVDHDCHIAAFVHLSPGVHLSGTVTIGKASWLGIGAIVSNNLDICGGCTIGAGAVVINNVEKSGTYIGIPARKLGN